MKMKLVVTAAVFSAVAVWPVHADSITAKEIAAGISDEKTELEQESWWKDNMAEKRHEITGKVTDVEEGSFSGYWIDLDIGRNLRLRCGLPDAYKSTAMLQKKGKPFTCKGVTSTSWTSVFGKVFTMDFES
ncbi:hypothetical protein FJ872_19350 [Mesorhizobium sp. B2-5-9]|uniref:hypothetical protein n=1 Tax=Mesorhizobium sp. B2-5-9 TaxID=2589921 RepID=UPI001126B680|nr:hypothetical protein [Mesorhizobium sp. B2-5-9]TPK15157.1 hypothetical protein FJ872_19350 [Mesorhizobium sp. B2-5-9]